MFTGIIESNQKLINTNSVVNQSKSVLTNNFNSLTIFIQKPKSFDDLKTGDSVAVNGVCLTLESQTVDSMQFTLGFETLQVLRLNQTQQWSRFNSVPLNLERSLKFGDRIHGHLVTGHVDTLGIISKKQWVDSCLLISVQIENQFKSWVWPKGSICLQGVSLTVNSVKYQPFSDENLNENKNENTSRNNIDNKNNNNIDNKIENVINNNRFEIEVCLIPETIQRTNLSLLQENDFINVEFDYYAKAIVNYEKNKI